MKHLFLVLFLCFSLLSLHAQQDAAQIRDSLFQLLPILEGEEKLKIYDQIYQLTDYGMNPEDNLRFLKEFQEEAHKQGHIGFEVAMRAQELNFYFNHQQKDQFLEVYPRHEAFLKQNNPELMLTMWSLKVSFYLFAEQYDEAMEEAETMRTEISKKNDPYLLGVVIAQIGTIYYLQGHSGLSIPLLIEALDLMEKKLPYDLITVFDTYVFLINAYLKEKRMDEALYYNAQYEILISKEEESIRLEYGDVENNIRLIVNRFYCYNQYIIAYLDKDELNKVETYLAKCEELLLKVSEGMKGDFHYTKSLFFEKKEDYDQAAKEIRCALEVIEAGELTTTEAARPGWYKLHGHYLAKAGQYEEAIQSYDTAYVQLEASNHHEFEKRLTDLRTRYEVDRLEMEKERSRNYLFFVLGICILLILILLLTIRHHLRLRIKNRNLVKQIENQDALQKELRAYRRGLLSDSDEKKENVTSEAILFAKLEKYMHDTGVYINPELDRQQLINALATNQTYLYNAVKTATGMSLQEYINSLRLELAKGMLKNRPDATILQIATQCGFTTIQTFRRQFKDYYGITASDFRKP